MAGIIRLVKNEYTQAQAGLKNSDEAKYGAYMGLLDDEDRAKMENGKLVKDQTMYRIINKIFEEPWIANAKHIFFNGFPRNISQWNAIREGKVLLRGKPLRIDFLFISISPGKPPSRGPRNGRKIGSMKACLPGLMIIL